MQQVSQLTEFGKIFIFLITGIVLVLMTFFLAKLVAPNKPNPEKLTSYECGEEPVGSSWMQFNSRFYVIALIFLLFDAELVFIFPWTTVFAQQSLLATDARWGWLTLTEMFVFVGILLMGLVYVWKKGDLEWIKPEPVLPKTDHAIPLSVYNRINEERYTVKPFTAVNTAAKQPEEPATAAAPKPMFKPTFRKPAQP